MPTTKMGKAPKPAGSSLPARKMLPLPPVCLEDMLVGEESDEASDSEVFCLFIEERPHQMTFFTQDDDRTISDDDSDKDDFSVCVLPS
jgi:hypothetical protein